MALLSSKHKQSVTGYGYNNTVKRIFYANDCGLDRHKPTRFSIAAPLNVLGINKLLLGPKLIRWRAFHTTFKTFLKCWWDKELLITSCTTYPMSCFTSDKRYQRSQQDATLHNKKKRRWKIYCLSNCDRLKNAHSKMPIQYCVCWIP